LEVRVTPESEYEIGIGAYRFDPAAGPPKLPDTLRLDVGAERVPDRPGWFLVQFTRPLTAEDRTRIQSHFGLRLRDYVPNLAYVERLELDTLRALAADELVRSLVPYHPAFKLAPTIGKVPPRTEERKAAKETPFEALLFDDADASDVTAHLTEARANAIVVFDDRALGAPLRIRFRLADPASLEQVARIEQVRWVEEVAEIIEDDASAAGTIQSGSAGNQSIWDRDLHGEDQIIGIIDSSPVDMNHCFFRDPNNNDPGPTHRKVTALRNGSETTPTRHATFVAGCAAGDDFNNPGTAGGRGSAWAARLVSGNREDFGIFGIFFELNAAMRAGATIHTNSWHNNTAGAGNPATYNLTALLVDYLTWKNEDHLVLGSAGNSGEEQGPPGTAKNAICVAAAQADPNEMNLGDGNPGPTADGRRKPDLVAVGCGIRSARVGTTCGTQVRGCASSWATPHAAGAAVLVRQYFTEGWYPGGEPAEESRRTPSGALLKATLLNSTLNMTGVGGYPSNNEGWGLLRLDDVLTFPGSPRVLAVWDRRHADGLSTGEKRTEHVDVVSGRGPLKVTLVWTEPPGAAGADNPMVNDLNLRVTSPDGRQTFLGNNFVAGQSVVGGTRDTQNNVEVVVVPSPMTGKWSITVAAARVAVGDPAQGYAVVATTGRPDWLVPALNITMG
jgi:hypothetical protein